MIDWNKVADTLSNLMRMCRWCDIGYMREAIALCERMARGELVERPDPTRCYHCGLDLDYSVWLIDGKCSLWNAGFSPSVGERVLSGTYEMCAAAVRAAPCGYRPIDSSPTEDERAHCVEAVRDYHSHQYRDLEHLVEFQRAAVRASCAAEIERLRKQIDDLSESLDSVCGYCQDGCRCK